MSKVPFFMRLDNHNVLNGIKVVIVTQRRLSQMYVSFELLHDPDSGYFADQFI